MRRYRAAAPVCESAAMAHHFEYRRGELYAEEVPIRDIAARVGTPFYCYSTATLARHYHVIGDALAGVDARIYYSLKANSNLAVVRTLAEMGAGADIVSGGELERALRAGIAPRRVVFSGVGKTDRELGAALAAGIFQFNVESLPELLAIDRLAAQRNLVAPVAVRVNPNVDAATHAKITTGTDRNKFGIAAVEVGALCHQIDALPGVELVGLAMHIGSQLLDLAPFDSAFASLRALAEELRAEGRRIDRIDIGGGLGIPYGGEQAPAPAAYAELVVRHFGDLGCHLMLEPGRLIVGNAGLMVARVLYVKDTPARRFIIVDAAMNDLLRPALYDARHEIRPVAEAREAAARSPADVVGPVCESGDTFATACPLPPLDAGDLLAFAGAGAYGAVMASSYNTRPLIPEVLVKGSDFAIVRARPSVDDMLAGESFPAWLGERRAGAAAAPT